MFAFAPIFGKRKITPLFFPNECPGIMLSLLTRALIGENRIKRHQKPNNKKLCGFATLLINQNKISNFRFYETKNCVRHLPSLPLIFRPRVFLTEKQNKHNVSTILKMMKWENKTLFRNKKYMLNKIV